MNKMIRTNVFETNSSSCHSISISANTDYLDTIRPNEDGFVVLNSSSQFGWEEQKYNDAKTKAEYMYIYALDWANERSDEFIEKLKNVIREHTQCQDVLFEPSDFYTNWQDEQTAEEGYIDHQSVECQDYHYVFDNNLLKDFIFNPQSTLTTDNDNRDRYPGEDGYEEQERYRRECPNRYSN